jgi:glycosyltransferase involved in cell wall biosynthesis
MMASINKSKYKIVHFINSGGYYGAEKVLLNLLPEIDHNKFSISVGIMTPLKSEGARLGHDLAERGIIVDFLNIEGKFSIKIILKIFQYLIHEKPDLVHFHGYKATIYGGLICKVRRYPYVITYHAEAFKSDIKKIYFTLEDIFLKRAQKLFPVSEQIKNELIKRKVDKRKINVIHNGINDPITSCEKKIVKNSIKKDLTILSVGRLEQIKNHFLIIKSIKDLIVEHSNLKLTIAGDGPKKDEINATVKNLNLKNKVQISGYVNDVNSLYHAADIFVIASSSEGSPISLLEAMAHSLPIIATNVGSIPTMIRDQKEGLLIEANDQNALTKVLKRFINDRELAERCGLNARKRFEKDYIIKNTADKFTKEYLKLLQHT